MRTLTFEFLCTPLASMVKWISHKSSELRFRVRALMDAPNIKVEKTLLIFIILTKLMIKKQKIVCAFYFFVINLL